MTMQTARLNARDTAGYQVGLSVVLVTVTMLFAAFTAALFVRRGGGDWVPVGLPLIVWPNTGILVASSLAVEWSRREFRRGRIDGFDRWLAIGALLGVLFLTGQIIAWRFLAAGGVFLPTSPHAAFFYMLSAVHGAHVVGGLGALAWLRRRTARGVYTVQRQRGLTPVTIYWHFVGIVWIYVLALLSTL